MKNPSVILNWLMVHKIRGTTIYSCLEIFVLFILPVFLITLGVIPVERRGVVLICLTLLLIAILIKEKWTLKELGLRFDNLQSSLLPYMAFTIMGSVGIILIAQILGRTTVDEWWLKPHFQYGFLITSIIQEFAFRGFLIPKLKTIFNKPLPVILVNALIFAFIHIVFPQPLQLLPLGIVSGLGFATLYYYYPNLILITLSHTVLNFLVVLFCFFSFQTTC